VNYDEMDGDRLRLPANRNCYSFRASRELCSNYLFETAIHSLPYLTSAAGRGCYTCPALRTYQFSPLRVPELTIRLQETAMKPWAAVKPKSAWKPKIISVCMFTVKY